MGAFPVEDVWGDEDFFMPPPPVKKVVICQKHQQTQMTGRCADCLAELDERVLMLERENAALRAEARRGTDF